MTVELILGDCLESLQAIESSTVQCCVTSPPYYGLRDYGVDGQIGLESTPDEYVSKLVQVFREVKRVLKDDGLLWLNLGDSYAGGASKGEKEGVKQKTNHGATWGENDNLATLKANLPGLKTKDLIGIPWMVAFALRADGWYLRSDIIWAKPNPMPESVKDRPTKSHEYMFLLSKSQKYYYDADSIREPLQEVSIERAKHGWHGRGIDDTGNYGGLTHTDKMGERFAPENGRNKRSVWTINTSGFAGAHFAVMPEKLVEPCILAGSKPGDVILDPFSGSGTVGVVAVKNGRSYKGIDLNTEYIEMQRIRIFDAQQQMRLPL